MGSLVYARYCFERDDKIVAMISLETLGCYDDQAGTQKYEFPFGLFYPSRANFLGFIGNYGCRDLVRQTISIFRNKAQFPSEGSTIPGIINGVNWSDHWSFLQAGYPAIMVTDTAPFRYEYYHTPEDTPDKIDYERLTRVVDGLENVLDELAGVIDEPNRVPAAKYQQAQLPVNITQEQSSL
jgi:Zn-dependent M28 family amino/carboxypeptidase